MFVSIGDLASGLPEALAAAGMGDKVKIVGNVPNTEQVQSLIDGFAPEGRADLNIELAALVPTGGVTLRNLAEFFKAGCPAVGVGSTERRKVTRYRFEPALAVKSLGRSPSITPQCRKVLLSAS